MKQIILLTDGCSNVGISPAVSAAEARAEGIIVNVIGITDGGEWTARGEREIEEIAKAGGGMSRVVHSRDLSQTVQMMTRRTVTHTIHQVVSKELKQILGSGNGAVEQLPLEQRAKVVQVMDDLTERSSLKVAVLVDASASMRAKLQAVREAIADLSLSLRARQGSSQVAVFYFPGNLPGEYAVMDSPWTNNIAELDRLLVKLTMQGTTPTGPALQDVVRYFVYGTEQQDSTAAIAGTTTNRDGMLSDYVV
ncbi:VWA domain-containing protein [Paenibacillus turpanensis]|uniref:VWA domain-containing protein n=1 Tax=Paenibacillus turpanensis TaxID=2689078 RepID=UPI00140954CF|nr:VWA domain-containing protein [Paenibacillus turpanensis]